MILELEKNEQHEHSIVADWGSNMTKHFKFACEKYWLFAAYGLYLQ